MSDRIRDGAHERRGIRDGAAESSVVGHHAPRRDDARGGSGSGRVGDEPLWSFYGDPDAQPDHGEENG